jgi:hypothetical protein
METGRENQPTPASEDESSPLLTGFWLGFWSLLLLIVGSWFINVPLIGRNETHSPQRNGRVSLFREAPREAPQAAPAARGLAGAKRNR